MASCCSCLSILLESAATKLVNPWAMCRQSQEHVLLTCVSTLGGGVVYEQNQNPAKSSRHSLVEQNRYIGKLHKLRSQHTGDIATNRAFTVTPLSWALQRDALARTLNLRRIALRRAALHRLWKVLCVSNRHAMPNNRTLVINAKERASCLHV